MSTRQRFFRVVEFISLMGDVIAVAAAVNEGRQPREQNLHGIGIDPEQFRQIERR